jgi:hypothetical protein
VARTPDSYSEDPVFKSLPGDGLIQVLCGFSQYLQAHAGIDIKLGRYGFLPYPLKIIIHPVIRRYII